MHNGTRSSKKLLIRNDDQCKITPEILPRDDSCLKEKL